MSGEIRQDSNLDPLIWGPPEIISRLSHHFELRPGNIILTGAPSDVGAVEAGDRLEGRIDGLAPLDITIAPARG